MLFRQAIINDYEQVLELKKQVHMMHVKAEPGFYKDAECVMTKDCFKEELGKEHIYVLEDNNKIIGYIFYYVMEINNNPLINDQKILFIDDLCVDNKHKGYSGPRYSDRVRSWCLVRKGNRMSEHKRGRWSKEQKFKIALAAIRGDKTIAQLAEEFKAHPNQISEWKKHLLEHGADVFSSAAEKADGLSGKEREDLIQTIGHQTVVIDWLKKRLGNEDYRSALK